MGRLTKDEARRVAANIATAGAFEEGRLIGRCGRDGNGDRAYQCWWNALFKIFHSPPAFSSVKKSVYR